MRCASAATAIRPPVYNNWHHLSRRNRLGETGFGTADRQTAVPVRWASPRSIPSRALQPSIVRAAAPARRVGCHLSPRRSPSTRESAMSSPHRGWHRLPRGLARCGHHLHAHAQRHAHRPDHRPRIPRQDRVAGRKFQPRRTGRSARFPAAAPIPMATASPTTRNTASKPTPAIPPPARCSPARSSTTAACSARISPHLIPSTPRAAPCSWNPAPTSTTGRGSRPTASPKFP